MSHATLKNAWLLFFFFERAGDQRKEAKESRRIIDVFYNV